MTRFFRKLFLILGIVAFAAAFIGGVSFASASSLEPSPAMQVAALENDEEGDNDPLESLNRIIFEINEFFYTMVLRPVSIMYQTFLPPPVREAVSNVLDNLSAPVILMNDILQGEPGRAWETTQRFVVNSTIGVAGVMDLADSWLEIPEHDEDFGQTLAVWGVGEGLYLVLPLFGPSNPRDGVGKLLVDAYVDPFNNWTDNTDREELMWTRTALNAVDEYSGLMDELDQIKKTSIDYYAAIRSMYRQKRKSDISNGEALDMPPILDLSYDYNQDPFGKENLE
ncbi:MAG: VacJ family lipoprotein [Rhodospirillales bacterium]